MSKHLSELCTILIEDALGDLAAQIFLILFSHGRLALDAVVRYAKLPSRHVKHGLTMLVQQGLVLYNTEDATTFYEASLTSAYSLVRIGKSAKIVEDHINGDAARMILELSALGKAKGREVIDTICTAGTAKEHTAPGVNGVVKPGVNGVKRKRSPSSCNQSNLNRKNVLFSLDDAVRAGYIVKVKEIDHLPEADLDTQIEMFVTRRDFPQGVKGTKAQQELVLAMQERKRDLLSDTGKPTNLERRSRGPQKRRKLNGADSLCSDDVDSDVNEKLSDDEQLENPYDDQMLRVNHDKLNVCFRSKQLVELSARCLGGHTAKVYATLLRLMESGIARCHDVYIDAAENDWDGDEGRMKKRRKEEKPELVTTSQICDALDPSIDLAAVFPPSKSRKERIKHEDVSMDDRTAFSEDESEEYQGPGALANRHLQMLANDPHEFVKHRGGRGQGQWEVDFKSLAGDLIQFELEALFTARFGATATRVVRILHEKGKLDEKQVATLGLIRTRELRALLTAMQEAGYVDTQEVPRDNTRQPSRTIYLWFFDQDRCRQLVLNDLYKGMARLLQRARVEREKVQTVLEKADRTDVRGRESELLSKPELEALEEWRSTEERLLVQLDRLDDLVALFRDFVPHRRDGSLST